MTDLFLSYRSKEAPRLHGLLEDLKQAGISIWRDEERIDSGDSISDAVRAGLSSSKALLVWCTPDYHESRICRWELSRAWIAASAAGRPTDRVFLLLPPGVEDPRRFLPQELLGPAADASIFRFPVDPALLPGLAAALHHRLQGLDGRSFGQLAAFDTPAPWPIREPGGSNRFVGRERELWQLHGLLQAHRHVAVTGVDRSQTVQTRALGGMGKTLLATEYALLFQGAWPGGIFWFDVGGQSREDLLRTVMTQEGLADLRATRAWLKAQPPYLWVLDNMPPELSQRQVEELGAPTPQGAPCSPPAAGPGPAWARSWTSACWSPPPPSSYSAPPALRRAPPKQRPLSSSAPMWATCPWPSMCSAPCWRWRAMPSPLPTGGSASPSPAATPWSSAPSSRRTCPPASAPRSRW